MRDIQEDVEKLRSQNIKQAKNVCISLLTQTHTQMHFHCTNTWRHCVHLFILFCHFYDKHHTRVSVGLVQGHGQAGCGPQGCGQGHAGLHQPANGPVREKGAAPLQGAGPAHPPAVALLSQGGGGPGLRGPRDGHRHPAEAGGQSTFSSGSCGDGLYAC